MKHSASAERGWVPSVWVSVIQTLGCAFNACPHIKDTNLPLVLTFLNTCSIPGYCRWAMEALGGGCALGCCRMSEAGAQHQNLFIGGSCGGSEGFTPTLSAVQVTAWSFRSPVYTTFLCQTAQTQRLPAWGSQHCRKKTFFVLPDPCVLCSGVLPLISMIAIHKTGTKKSLQKLLQTKISTQFPTCLARTMGCFTWENPWCSQPWDSPWGFLLPLWWKLKSLKNISLLCWG